MEPIAIVAATNRDPPGSGTSNAPKSAAAPRYGMPTYAPASIRLLPGARRRKLLNGMLPSVRRGPMAIESSRERKSSASVEKPFQVLKYSLFPALMLSGLAPAKEMLL